MKLEEGMLYIIEIIFCLDGCYMWNLLFYYNEVNLMKLIFEYLLNGDIFELENVKKNLNDKYILEFIC